MERVYITRHFDQGPDQIFDALTSPSYITQWFGPPNMRTSRAEVDLRPGGRYRFELVRDAKSEVEMVIEGNYQLVEKPASLIFTLEYIGWPDRNGKSLVTIKLNPGENGGTELLFKQEFSTKPADMKNRALAWTAMLDRMESLLTP